MLKSESSLRKIRVAPIVRSKNVYSLAVRSVSMNREGFNLAQAQLDYIYT